MVALLAAAVLVCIVGGLGSVLVRGSEEFQIWVAGVAAAIAGTLGIAAALPVLISGHGASFTAAGPFPFAPFSVNFDPLAALMVLVISLVTVAAGIYSLAYVKDYAGRGVGAMGLFLNLFVASMLMVVVVDNAFYFLLFWELMTIASYFLVIFDQDQEVVDAGFLYFLVAHAFSMLILAAFFILFMRTGSLEFSAFRQAHLPPWLASVVFLLAFFGFAAKAGVIPMHIWLPRAHPAAPSHASALMSGVMIKLGIYGIIRVGFDLLGASQAWWGWMVLGFGVLSAVLGILYALAERDLKRMLAYSSVENIGIILMGTGLALIGAAQHQPLLASLGLVAALYHLLNHALFKGLLFLGAGALLFSTHTRDMMKMGGLSRRMPWTAVCFLLGALAISAIPPFNGFVSEWLTYQAFFTAGTGEQFAGRLFGPLAAMALALTGALTLMSLVKAWGLGFAGAPRSDAAAHAREVPEPMRVAMGALAALCVLLGFLAPFVVNVLSRVSAAVLHAAPVELGSGWLTFPGNVGQGVMSTPLVALLLTAALAVPLLIAAWHRRPSLPPRIADEGWACGYQHTPQMSVSAAGFAEPPRVIFGDLYALRDSSIPIKEGIDTSLEDLTRAAGRVEPLWDRFTSSLSVEGIENFGRNIQAIEGGDLRVYCLYILVALAVLLLAALLW